jgi:hypothetical protein
LISAIYWVTASSTQLIIETTNTSYDGTDVIL